MSAVTLYRCEICGTESSNPIALVSDPVQCGGVDGEEVGYRRRERQRGSALLWGSPCKRVCEPLAGGSLLPRAAGFQ